MIGLPSLPSVVRWLMIDAELDALWRRVDATKRVEANLYLLACEESGVKPLGFTLIRSNERGNDG